MSAFEQPATSKKRTVYTLRHIETGEFVCLRRSGEEYLAAFSQSDCAQRFRTELQLTEFVDIAPTHLASVPFERYYLDGELTTRSVLTIPH